MARKTYFFAIQDDLLGLCEAVEARGPLTYVRAGQCKGPKATTYPRARKIRGFGRAKQGEALLEESFLVLDRTVPVRVDPIRSASTAAVGHFVGARLNREAINLSPGGDYQGEAIIEGLITCFANTKSAFQLYGRFQRALRKSFLRARDTPGRFAYVGAAAVEAYRNGIRLTQSVRSPPEWDFKIVEG